jgi:hypothetical protein
MWSPVVSSTITSIEWIKRIQEFLQCKLKKPLSPFLFLFLFFLLLFFFIVSWKGLKFTLCLL